MSSKTDLTLAFTGNPNCGKSSLFNLLTGAKQQIGNWPGVTVERVEGRYQYNNQSYNIVDLPGIYSLSPNSEDEQVSRDYILSGKADLIVNILDSSNLSRNMYLTAQLIEMKVPVVVVLNMMDLAESSGLSIDIDHLSAHLKCPVIGVSAVNQKDISKLKNFLEMNSKENPISSVDLKYPNEIEDLVRNWKTRLEIKAQELNLDSRWMTLRLIEEDPWVSSVVCDAGIFNKEEMESELKGVTQILNETPDMIIADYVYGAVNGITREVVKRIKKVKPLNDIVDSVVMHPIFGIPIFFAAMMLVFFVTIEVGNIFVDLFDTIAGMIFVDGVNFLLSSVAAPEIISYFIADGIGAGIQVVISFIPFVFFMFLMLSLLEDSGYMARAAFVMDSFMGKLGLPGKAFVPMIVGFGCTVPAILATRTLDNKRDRMITIFMVPMMSCGARLPVYALFAAAFFPTKTGLIVFSLYMTGILVAVLSGLLIKVTLFRGEPSHLIMELPRYHVPRAKHILLHTWARVQDFIKKAGKVIIIAVFIMSIFSSFSVSGGFDPDNTAESLLAVIGRFITPLFTSIGITDDNWPATVGLFTGIFAKESIVGTLNAIYSQLDNIGPASEASTGLVILRSKFSPPAAYAYLLFILLYMPCVAAVSAVMKEISVSFGLLQALYLTVVAWIISTLFYQIAEGHSPVYIFIASALVALIILIFKIAARSVPKDDINHN
ncbi:ferrous iron transport protein B [Oceanispirochaeta sp.]|jgi:ferrous iron transport protein B|uniref:ferrous iron transport protein B n=1 Tax=Oceanispirochaeta sp. TaxID=2035350 RepID=UPI002617E9B3|nr:ferrous iron transport protein B [Oceanispirochaeta sp.]MDA3957125.1 ferrous iron transport protein B [Oceanispirochaeta sp.]